MTPSIGERWAYREKAKKLGNPLRPVDVLQLGPSRSRKVRIRWADGEYEGLDEWVPMIRLLVPWVEAHALLEDERRLVKLEEASASVLDPLVWDAAKEVWFAATLPEEMGFDSWTPRIAGLPLHRAVPQRRRRPPLEQNRARDRLFCLR